MPKVRPTQTAIDMDLPDEAATNALASTLAGQARPGDVIALSGELGTGKTVFARAFITARAGTPTEVPSPTFTLVQVYDLAGGAVYHFDLFRLSTPDEVQELGTEEAFADGISLIEWPDRLGPWLPADRLDIALAFAAGEESRHARLEGSGTWPQRLREAGLG